MHLDNSVYFSFFLFLFFFFRFFLSRSDSEELADESSDEVLANITSISIKNVF